MPATEPPVGTPPHGRAASLARRMLAGQSRARITAHNAGAAHHSLAHGLLNRSTLALAMTAPRRRSPLDAEWREGSEQVRVSLEKSGFTAHARVTFASCHFLGDLTWLSPADAAELERRGTLPATVAVAARAGAQVALVTLGRLLVHDVNGVTPLNAKHTDLTAAPAHGIETDPFLTHELAPTVSEAAARTLSHLVRDGAIDGIRCVSDAPLGLCAPVAQLAAVIDVDATGITLMTFEDAHVVTTLVPFEHSAADAGEAAAYLDGLVTRAASALGSAAR
ncbi:MAG: hypothetical protein Q4G21_01920 [Dermabacter sp.]|nr:hypothetical protein [Dermabacter sp.]